MTELTNYALFELRALIEKKEIKPQEVLDAYFQSLKSKNQQLNAYILVTEAEAYKRLETLDETSPLYAMPIAVKDNFCTKNISTRCASKILENFVPNYESTITSNLFEAGAIMLGKANMDEFAMGSTNETSAYGRVINPIMAKDNKEELVPGGSSGGSSAAVAANMAVAAIGSDTGGSIRQPASFCGVVGLKPSYGRCSRWGLIAFASSLDQAGPITKNVKDAALMLEAMAGYDDKDSTSVKIATENYADLPEGDLKNVKIGIPSEYNFAGLNSEIKQVWEDTAKLCKDLGAEIIDIKLKHTEYAAPTYYILNTAEASSNLARYDGVRYGNREFAEGDTLQDMYAKSRAFGFGEEVKRRIALGTYVLSAGYYDAYYKKAQALRRLISADFTDAFTQVDFILTPTTPKYAYSFNNDFSNIQTYLNDAFTVAANLAGIPAISLPAGLTKNSLPIGMQLMSKAFSEKALLQQAYILEQALAFDRSKLAYRI